MDKTKLEARLKVIAEEASQLLDEQRTELDRPDEDRNEDEYADRESRLDELAKERTKVEGQLTRIDRIEKLAKDEKHLVEGVSFTTSTKKDPFDLNDLRWNTPTGELRGRARTAIEEVESYMSDDQREAVAQKLNTVEDARGIIPNLVIRTGNDHYRRAFQKAMAGRQDLWTHDERTAVASLEEYRTAMGLTGDQGGFAVPFTLDPTLILTNAGTNNPVRQVARQVSITTDAWNGLSSAGATGAWLAESTEVAESTLVFAQPNIPVFKGAAFIRGSIEINQDYQAIEADIGMIVADAKDRLEGTAFIHGAGATEPTGIITALDGGSSEVEDSGAEGSMQVSDVYRVMQALPPRYRSGAVWLAELSTINTIRQFATANNYHGFLTDLAGDTPPVMLGKRLFESSDMDAFADINTAATADNHVLLYGNFEHYVIVDRIGLSLEFIPHLFATATNFPSGERGWFAHWRVGADSIVDDAFRVLNIVTAA